MRFAVVLVLLVVLGCSSDEGRAVTSPSVSPGGYLGSLGSPGCKSAAPFHSYLDTGQPEAGFDSTRGSFWALFFNPVPPPPGKEIKVVWKMTGHGAMTFGVTDADGKTASLAWGPDVHYGSSWSHAGLEAGTGLNFSHAGCWQVHVARDDASGDLWLEVANPA